MLSFLKKGVVTFQEILYLKKYQSFLRTFRVNKGLAASRNCFKRRKANDIDQLNCIPGFSWSHLRNGICIARTLHSRQERIRPTQTVSFLFSQNVFVLNSNHLKYFSSYFTKIFSRSVITHIFKALRYIQKGYFPSEYFFYSIFILLKFL